MACPTGQWRKLFLVHWAVVAVVLIGPIGVVFGDAVGRSVFGYEPRCVEGMERAISGREDEFRSVFASLIESVNGADRRQRATTEAFLGMKYVEFCGGHLGEWSDTAAKRALRNTEPSNSELDDFSAISKAVVIETDSLRRTKKERALSYEKSVTTRAAVSSTEDCGTLADLYDTTGGPDWYEQRGWNNRTALLTDCCRAFGVECDNMTGRVTRLQLINNNLRGPIPSTIGRLHYMTTL